MRKVLLTGGIGSGKSLAANYLRDKGLFVYDSDSQARRLYREDESLRQSIKSLFGDEVFADGGDIDRKTLAAMIFADDKALEALEALVHPAVMSDFLAKASAQGSELVIMESAIAASKPLFKDFFDLVLVVTAPEETRLWRVCRRDGADRPQVLARMRAQDAAMLVKADYLIENNGSPEELFRQLEEICKQLKISK